MKKSYSLCFLFLLFFSVVASAQRVSYRSSDSIKVESMLRDYLESARRQNPILYFAERLKGIKYVPKTLDRDKVERLVVNLGELDCTTYVETVLAMALCAQHGESSFNQYCKRLRNLRYKNGVVDYPCRLHYFTDWIINNTKSNQISEIMYPVYPNSREQVVNVSFMSNHINLYPMLRSNASWIDKIKRTEKELTGKRIRYIPKSLLRNVPVMKKIIKSGDIVAIVTNKQGLDISHLGFAVWRGNTLNFINASMIWHRVKEEPVSMYKYMLKHPSQIGIRVLRLNK